MIRKLRLLVIGLLALGTFGLASPSAAAFDLFGSACTPDTSDATVCKDNDTGQTQADNRIYGPNGIVTKIVTVLSIIIGVAAVIVIIIAGIQYMVSTGDPTKVNNAKNAIIYAVIGLVIAVAARTIVVFVIGKLG